ncbi:rcc01693 family protein [Cognatishimia sp. SS12]|uniref:rcc01693 family protein n=1 Tax=Cognatishimia sp. SS12 TaxID=2979465 RepID=UPI002FEDE98E
MDWAGLMRVGLGGLRLTPDQFWALTPAELALMLGEPEGGQAMDRAALNDLIAAYPDATEGTSE